WELAIRRELATGELAAVRVGRFVLARRSDASGEDTHSDQRQEVDLAHRRTAFAGPMPLAATRFPRCNRRKKCGVAASHGGRRGRTPTASARVFRGYFVGVNVPGSDVVHMDPGVEAFLCSSPARLRGRNQ